MDESNRLIFKTFEQIDRYKNITDGLDFFWRANEKQKKFDKDIFGMDLERQITAIDAYTAAYDKTYNKALDNKAEAVSKARQEIEWASDATKQYCIDTDRAAISADEFAKKQTAQFEAQQKSKKGFKGFSSSMKAMGLNIGAELLAGLLINGLMTGISALNDKYKLTAATKVEAMESAVNNYNSALSKSKDNISTIKSMQTEFAVLSQGVNDSGKNIGLSADEFERYNQIVSELTSMNPELIQGYTTEGNAIVNRNTAIQEAIKLQQEYAQQATKTYISNSTGKDIIGGAKANMHSATQDMREAARNVAENLADNLKGSEVKDTSSAHRRAKLKHTENKELNELLGENLNIETATSEKLREIAARREEILKTAKQSGQYSEEEYSNLEGFLVNLSDASNDYDVAIQPIYDWLSTYASQFNEQLTTAFGDSLPQGMQSAYEAGLKEIAGSGKAPEEMKVAAKSLSNTLADMYADNTGNYQSILQKAKQAEEDFMNSDRLKADAEKYNDIFVEQADSLDALASKYEETDAALAASLQSQANSMRNFVEGNKLSLNSAVHAFDEYITEARTAKEKFDSAMEGGDYYTAIDGLKEVYDTIDDKKNDSGKGSLAFWQGAEQILGTEALRDAEYNIDKVKSKLNELKPALNGGEEGTAKLFAMLAKEANGSGKILNEFGEKIATVKEAVDGTVSFNVPEENYAAVARQLGVSVDMLTAMIDNARQFANVDFHNIKEVMAALREFDSAIEKDGQVFADRGSLEQETGLHGKEFDNLVKEMESKGAQILDTSASVAQLNKQLIGLGDAQKSADGFTHINLDDTLADFKQMNMSLEDVEYFIDKLKHSNEVKIDGDTDNISEAYAALGETEEVETPLGTATNAVEKLTTSINALIEAMGSIPPLDIDTAEGTLSDVDSSIEAIKDKMNADISGMTTDQRQEYVIGVRTDISDAESQLDFLIKRFDELPDGEEKVKIKAEIDAKQQEIDNLKESLTEVSGGEYKADLDVDIKKGLPDKISDVEQSLHNTDGTKATAQLDVNLPQSMPAQIGAVNQSLDGINGKISTATVNINDSATPEVQEAASAIDSMNGKTATAIFKGDNKDVTNKAKQATSSIESVPKNHPTIFTGDPGNISSTVSTVKGLISSIPTSKTIKISATQTITKVIEEVKKATSTAKGTPGRRTGSAPIDSKARGGGKKKGGMTLTGELAPELVWLPSQEEAIVVGQYGPEMINLPADAVVYPGDETRRILAGRNNHKEFTSMGRGSEATGSYNPRKYYGKSGSGSGKSTGKSTSKSKTPKSTTKDPKTKDTGKDLEKTAKKTAEMYDWIEIKLDRIQRKIDMWNKAATRTNRLYKSRKAHLNEEYRLTKKEIALQQKAYHRYQKQAAKVKISKNKKEDKALKEQIRNGKIDITKIKGEKKLENVNKYREYYEKALDARNTITDLITRAAEIQQDKFDQVVTKFEQWQDRNASKVSMIEERMNQAENKGHMTSTQYYTRMKQYENLNLDQLRQERKELRDALKEGMKSGEISKGSEMWNEMVNSINDVSVAIEEGKTKVAEYDKAIRELNNEYFDYVLDRISEIAEESDFLIDIMSNDKLYDDKGQFTDEGMATMGLHGVNYNTYMNEADRIAAEIKKIDKEIAKDPASQEWIDRKQELIEKQHEVISAAEDEKDAIVDMVEEGIKLELDALKELIDSYTDALQSQKDLYDYQKKISDQTKDIASLQKQLSAYANDTSEESKAKIQKLKVSLEDAQQDLKDTEYDHYIDAQKELLNDLYDEYEEILNKRLDNVDALVSDMIDATNKNAATIAETIEREAGEVGYNTTETMKSIWEEGGAGHAVIKMYGEEIAGQTTTLSSAISDLSKSIWAMKVRADFEASKDIGQINQQLNLNQGGSSKGGSNLLGGSGTFGPVNLPAPAEKKVESKILDSDFDKFLKKYKKKYTGDKAAAEKNHYKTITGMLKYNNLDPSVSAQKAYWKKLGNKGEYKDTAEQNKTLIAQFKKRGYARGARSIMKNQMAWTNEGAPETIIRKSDGAILTPLKSGDMVLNPDAHSNIWSMASDPTKFIRDHFDLPTPTATNVQNDNRSSDSYQNDYHIEISLPNVQSYEDFVAAMQHDKKLEKMLQDMTVNQVFGGSSLKKYKY